MFFLKKHLVSKLMDMCAAYFLVVLLPVLAGLVEVLSQKLYIDIVVGAQAEGGAPYTPSYNHWL